MRVFVLSANYLRVCELAPNRGTPRCIRIEAFVGAVILLFNILCFWLEQIIEREVVIGQFLSVSVTLGRTSVVESA